MEERIKKNSTISGLIDNMGTVVYLPNGKKYNFFPYWFESTTQEMEDYMDQKYGEHGEKRKG